MYESFQLTIVYFCNTSSTILRYVGILVAHLCQNIHTIILMILTAHLNGDGTYNSGEFF